MCIEDPKYGRNALIFNAGVVLTSHAQYQASDADDFGPVVTKLASILQTLEVRVGPDPTRACVRAAVLPRAVPTPRLRFLLLPAVRVRDAVGQGKEKPAGKDSQVHSRRHQPLRALRGGCWFVHQPVVTPARCGNLFLQLKPALFTSVPADEVNTIHLQIGVAADTLPPADGRQVPVVVVEPPEISSGQRGDLTLKKVGRPPSHVCTQLQLVLLNRCGFCHRFGTTSTGCSPSKALLSRTLRMLMSSWFEDAFGIWRE